MNRPIWGPGRRLRAVLLFSGVSVYALAAIGSASAENAQTYFSIPAQPLSEALLDYGRQADVSIAVFGNLVEGKQAPAISGSNTPVDALRLLLAGSGLEFEFTSPNSVRVYGPSERSAVRSALDAEPKQPEALEAPLMEEVIVTARRVEENAQIVPIAITALSATALRGEDNRDVFSLVSRVPELTINGRPGTIANTFIRGLQGVVPYFANAPTDLSGFGNTFDIDNLQVLKGPQGTLFGIASNGGAVLYEPKKPTSEFGGYAEVTTGNYGRKAFEGVVNIPAVQDKLRVRAGVQYFHIDGYTRDITTNGNLNDQNYQVGRISAVLDPTDNLSNYTILQYYSFHDTPAPYILGLVNQPSLGVNVNFAALNLVPGGLPAVQKALATQIALGPYRIDGLSTALGKGGVREYTESISIVNTTSWNVSDDLLLKNIFAVRNVRSLSIVDLDDTPLPILDGDSRNKSGPGTPTWSNELQLQGKTFSDKLNFTFGFFNSGSHTNPTTVFADSYGSNVTASITKNSSLTRAIYGEGTYDLSEFIPGLSFTGGYRHTWDMRSQRYTRLDPATLLPNFDVAKDADFHAGGYTASLQYQYSTNTMFYLTDSKGYSAGGIQLTAPSGFQIFRPETLDNLEIGVKSTFDVGRIKIRSNFSAYYGWYDNVLATVAEAVQVNPVPSPKSLLVVTQNAATAHIEGIDGEITVVPIDGVEFGGSFAYMNDVYEKWNSIDPQGNPISLTGVPFTLTPKFKYNIFSTYHLPVERYIGDISVTLSYSHSSVYYTPAGVPLDQLIASGIVGAGFAHGPYQNLDISLDWHNMTGIAGLDSSFVITNVTENVFGAAGLSAYEQAGVTGEAPAIPREFFFRLRYGF